MKIFLIGQIGKKLTLFSLAITLLLATACEHLEVKPKEFTKDKDFLKNFWDADFMMRGVYQGLQNIVEPTFILGEVRADWVTPGTGISKDIQELAEHKVTANNKYTDWSPYYDLINRANYAITNLQRVPMDSTYFNAKTKRQLTAEAKFLRCLAYFHLVRNFKDVPFFTESVDDLSKVQYLSATSGDKILDFIEIELQQAYINTDKVILVLNTFDIGYRDSNEQTRMRATKGTVAALLAHVYNWRNKYQESWNTLVKMEIDAEGATHWTNWGAFGNADWFSFFTTPVVFQEFLLDVAFRYDSRENNPLMKITSNDPKSGGLYLVAPSLNAMKTYHPNYPAYTTVLATDDVHRGFGRSFAGSAPFYNRLGSSPVIWKWLGTGVVNPANINVPPSVRAPYESDALFRMFRVADTWLLRGEVLNRLNRKVEAIAHLNNMRGRAGRPNSLVTVASTTDEIEDAILQERGLELGFEGYRWYDLMRMANHRNSPKVLIDAVKRRAPVSMHTYLEGWLSNSAHWYLPYNANEIRLNPNLKPKG